MNILVQPHTAQFELPQRFLLHGVNWQTYEKILEAIGNRPVRITYDRGNLELMSPLPIHEFYKCFFGRLFDILAEELDIAFRACGSTTFRRQDVDRGLEPDQCFYFGSIARVHDWATLNLEIDPPPDLAVEVDNTHSCLDRMGIYARLGVPEVWRVDGETLQIYHLLADGTYEMCHQSPSLPFIDLAEIVPFLLSISQMGDDREQLRSLRRWVRERVLPRRQAFLAQQSLPEEPC